ncbi:hypothetical protein [Amycolatopsis sp. CA-128772]|nr:hypothetical protein [Amycolatopsis sp. CA-128772]
MIHESYVRARMAEVRHEFAAVRRWRRRVTRLLGRARAAREPAELSER